MPCGGIWPHAPITNGERCYHCDQPGLTNHPLRYFVEEWDASIHEDCLDPFLTTRDGKLVLEHGHEVIRLGGTS
jgi:hypothetical protein